MKIEKEIAQDYFKSEHEKAVVNLIFTYNWFINFQTNRLKGYGLTVQQFNILRILRGQHPNPATIKLIKRENAG